MNRRQFLDSLTKALAGSALAPTSAALAFPFRRGPRIAKTTTFEYGPHHFPLLRPFDTVIASEKIRKIDWFRPLFAPDRPVVNPIEPKVVGGRKLVFVEGGEYYLRINGAALKVVVFPAEESIASALLRLFDFAAANTIYLGIGDNEWYSGRRRRLGRFFTDDAPLMLSCGPTHQMFRLLVAERFCLPTRVASAHGSFYRDGQIDRTVHNVPEVYLPDFEKFVLFDLNNGYVPLWMDALEFSERLTRKWSDAPEGTETLQQTGIRAHTIDVCPRSQQAVSSFHDLVENRISVPFENLVANAPLDDVKRALSARAFYGGAAYWGKLTTYVQPTGTEFLDGYLQFASYHEDPRLQQDVAEAWKDYRVEFVEPDLLRARLREGARPAIAAKEWTTSFPA